MAILAITIAIAILATFGSAAPSPFQQTSNPTSISESQARAELTAVLAERDMAAEKEDIDRFLTFYTSDFVWRLGGGRALSRQSWEELIRLKTDDQTLEHKQHSTIQNFKLRGNEAVLNVRSESLVKQRLQDGSIKASVSSGHKRETWIRTDQGWKLRLIDQATSEDMKVTINGVKVDPRKAPGSPLAPPANPDDRSLLKEGYALVFFYRLKDGTFVKTPVYSGDTKLAEMTGGSFFKAKLMPGKHTFHSDKGDAVEINMEKGKIYFLVVKIKAGFPRGRGVLELDTNNTGSAAYKLPELMELNPLGSDNVFDKSIVIVEKP